MEKTEVKTKRCSKCGRELPVSEFNKRARSADGLQSYCRECIQKYNNERPKTWGVTSQNTNKLNKIYFSEKLAGFTPRELIAELRARGYNGELTYVQKIKV